MYISSNSINYYIVGSVYLQLGVKYIHSNSVIIYSIQYCYFMVGPIE